jgi:hypothetical protein
MYVQMAAESHYEEKQLNELWPNPGVREKGIHSDRTRSYLELVQVLLVE